METPHLDKPPAETQATSSSWTWLEMADCGRKKCCKKYKKGKRCKNCPKR